MITPINRPMASSLNVFSRGASIFTALVGFLALAGWTFDIAVLKSILPTLATMKPNTGLAFILAGISLWLLQPGLSKPHLRRLAQLCALGVLLLGAFTLSEYLFGWDLGIDQLLFRDVGAGSELSHPGRMAPMTAFIFTLVGLACLFLDIQRGFRFVQGLILSAGFLSLLAVIGYLYGVEALYRIGPYSSMALHTAITFLVLALGLLSARTERGFTALLTSQSAGGLLARRLAPAALLVPITLGWFRLQGQDAGLYDTIFGLSLFAISNIVVFLGLIWWSANTLHQIDLRRQQAEATLRQINEELERRVEARTLELREANTQLQRELAQRQRAEEKFHGVLESAPDAIVIVDSTGQIVMVNAQTENLFGYKRAQLLDQPVELLLPVHFQEGHIHHRRDYFDDPHARLMGSGLELYGLRQDGTEFPIEVSLSPLETEEGLLVSSAIRDITERKQREAEIIQRNLENTQLLARTQDALTRTEALYQAGQALIGFESLPAMLQAIADGAAIALPADRVTLIIFDLNRRQVGHFVKSGPGSDQVIAVSFEELWQGLSGWVLRELKPALSPKDIPDPRESPAAQRRRAETNCGAIIVVPLKYQGQTLGTMTAINRPDERDFIKADVDLMAALANQAVIAIENTRLFEALRESEASLRASLKEKEAMLKEIHHRVKNNLQIISSLLRLQAGYITEPHTLAIFQESQNQVKSMALVHETLYQSHDLARIDFAQYLQQLIRYLKQAYGAQRSAIEIKLKVEAVALDLDTAISCGLIINELVSNALKYAFPERSESGQAHEIDVDLRQADGQVSMVVSDNGVGLPAEVDFQRTESLGLQLVYSLISDELDGTIEVERHHGTCFKLTFPKPTYETGQGR